MKLIRVLAVAIVSCVSIAASKTVSAEAISSTEYAAVLETANNYFNGLANGDQALLNTAFDMQRGHLKYRIKLDDGGDDVVIIPLDEFAKQFPAPTAETWTSEILSVDIVDGKMAMVKMNFHMPKMHFVDYLVMFKRDAGWRIVDKTSVAYPQ